MSKKRDLNVSMGLFSQPFLDDLKKVRRNLFGFSRRMEDIGRKMSQSLSIPLAAAGAGAIKAAADFERLELALVAITKSPEVARQRLADLRKEAEKPGLGFEQAVKADLAFQGLGLSAEKSLQAIRGVGKLVAASGGGQEAFEGVVKQLNQIQAKNRVLQEDLNIILENAPRVGEVLQRTFGAKTAEAIRARGVDGEQFFDILTKGLNKLPTVQSGLANNIENLGIAFKFAFAELGKGIDEAIGLQNILKNLSTFVGDLSDRFNELSPGVRKTIVQIGLLAAGIGPVILGAGFLASTLAALATPIGIIVIGASALAAGFIALYNNSEAFRTALTNTGQYLKSVFLVTMERLKPTFQQVGLFMTIATSELSKFFRESKTGGASFSKAFLDFIVSPLKIGIEGTVSLYNAFAGSIQGIVFLFRELGTVVSTVVGDFAQGFREFTQGNFSAALKSFGEGIQGTNNVLFLGAGKQLGSAFVEGFQDGFENNVVNQFVQGFADDIAKKRAELAAAAKDAANSSTADTGTTSTSPGTTPTLPSAGAGTGDKKDEAALKKAAAEALEAQTALAKFDTFLVKAVANTQRFRTTATGLIGPLETLGKDTASTKFFADLASQISLADEKARVFGTDALISLNEEIGILTTGLNNAIEKFGAQSDIVEALKNQLSGLKDEYEALSEQEALSERTANAFASAFSSAGSAVASAIESGENAFKAFANVAVTEIKKVITEQIKLATISYFTDAFSKLGIFGVALAAGAGAVVGGLAQAVLSQVPKLAEGGIVNQPTLALVGEGGREKITPLDRDGESSLNGMVLEHRISGTDLLFLLRQAGGVYDRTFG